MTNPYASDTSGSSATDNQFDIAIAPVPMPQSSEHRIALVGCGAIGKIQVYSYKQAGWNVVALCDHKEQAAIELRDEFFPDADVTTNYRDLLQRDDITLIDLALHLDIRPAIVREAILAGKHVMSQKPYVEKLAKGLELAELAETQGVTLAVNQNGRWAPHFRALRQVIEGGHIGELANLDFCAYWGHDLLLEDHVLGRDPDLVLYDFTIHWFDLIAGLLPNHTAKSVYAITGKRNGQVIPVPTLASIIIDFETVQVSINMRASARHENSGCFHVTGSRGMVSLDGASLGGRELKVVNDKGSATIAVEPDWFPHALIGSMADLLCAIENNESPNAHPRSSLTGLSLCFAAMQSAVTGLPVDPATVSARPGIGSTA